MFAKRVQRAFAELLSPALSRLFIDNVCLDSIRLESRSLGAPQSESREQCAICEGGSVKAKLKISFRARALSTSRVFFFVDGIISVYNIRTFAEKRAASRAR